MATYRIEHTTTYTYDGEVTSSYGQFHLRPRDLPWQTCLAHEIVVDPQPADLYRHTDLYGNSGSYFHVVTPHTALRVTGVSVVEMERVNSDFTYKFGSTSVSTRVSTLLRDRTGVCQDFSHFMISALRSLGLAGRYVSGYLATRPPPGRTRLVGVDATHAWVGCWVPGAGWLYLDPTNRRVIDESHATVAWGRDYGDVPPVKGVIFTEAKKSTMKVSVDMAPAV